MGRIEVSYFFASVAIAVICSVPGPDHVTVAIKLAMVLGVTFVVDHPRLLQRHHIKRLTLGDIDPKLLADRAGLRTELSARLGVDVTRADVEKMNLSSNVAKITVSYRPHGRAKAETAVSAHVQPAE